MSVVERALQNLKKAAAAAQVPTDSARAEIVSSPPTIRSSARITPTRTVSLSMERLESAGLFASGNQRLAEEYRLIKRPLLKTATLDSPQIHPRFPNLIMVASALAGEGKTFTSVNLAMSLASEKDWHTLLVDVDCRNPRLSRLLGVAEEPGLLDYLRNADTPLESVVLGTNVERLQILPVGTPGDDATELLGSSRMSTLCSILAERRGQLVIFDSSPLLLTTEPVALSSQVGQAVVVVNAHKTPRQAVADAVGKLDSILAVGLVLNGVNPSEQGIRYGGYGSYNVAPN